MWPRPRHSSLIYGKANGNFGEPALIGPLNHIDVHPQVDLALLTNLLLTLDWDCFWRGSTRDGIYGPAVNLIQTGKNSDARFVGHQAEALLEWRADRHFTLAPDYAHFFAGDFLKETTRGKMWTTSRPG